MTKISFKIKTNLLLFFLAITPIVLNGMFLYFLTGKTLKEEALKKNLEVNRLVTAQIEGFFAEAYKSAEIISKNPILNSAEPPLADKKTEIYQIAEDYRHIFQDIIFVNPEGKIISSTSFRFYGRFAKNHWFLEAKEKKEIVMSEIYAVSDPTQPVLTFFIPYLSADGKVIYLVVAQVNTDRILEVIASASEGVGRQVILIDSRGNIIGHAYKRLMFEKIAPSYPLLQASSLKSGTLEFNFQGEEVVGAFKVIEKFRQYTGKNWHLITLQAKQAALSLVRQIRNQTLIFFGIFASVSIFAAYIFSNYITNPLIKLSLAAKEVSRGNLNVMIKAETKDEIGELIFTFNQMVRDLKDYYTGLEETKKSLELQVKARTEELEALNQSLDREVKRQTMELQLKLDELEKSRKALLNILDDAEEARKKAEEEKTKTLLIVQNFADGLLLFDKDKKLSLVNSAAEKLLKIKREDYIGFLTSHLIKSAPFAPILNLLGLEINIVFRKELKISEDLILEITTVPLIEEGRPTGKLVILHDITREKIIEKLKTEFVSLAAHQLRTPLSAIKWSLQMVLGGDVGKITKNQREFLDKAYESNERMIKLINDLLNVTRIEEGRYLYKLTSLNLDNIVKEIIAFYKIQAKRKNIEIVFNENEQLFKVIVDEEKIKLAITNLIDNAIQYTPSGGKVFVCLKGNKKEISVSVQDTGIGIPSDQQERVFTKFFRAINAMKAQTEGTGLGLFITKNIIEAHGGKIWFESKEGKGTTFYFTLPVAKENNNEMETKSV